MAATGNVAYMCMSMPADRVWDRFFLWLTRSPDESEAVRLVPAVFVLDFTWSLMVAFYLNSAGLMPDTGPHAAYVPTSLIVLTFLFSAVSEELIFRIVPLTLALRQWGADRRTLTVLCISSVLFGWAHGSILHVLAQGINGLIIGILFIKFSNLGRNIWWASLLVIALHFIFDLLLLAMLYAMGSAY